ncbi:ankyrin repeat PH and SEC7 domain containing isoform A [Micractinium conductrix]|uniref:Ankyrin repeat PH and SEC7 domain containing isoform A n=1 Tax=Micractinium conductrix TaxID=554055 RepID=A0A2P6VAD8_9CHLO|nr:ankyrin repeat PH and SEC7 domain containing isoform B [Micractinium conductrix]PSC71059.1 ankyrin repeat PH and SEC7 domain containing isoform A [Micractinium conductrix]|eukprot:PSC71058.1 ankyrin repeat PH and SEC7 domain containing isoform B [Micractinium conductrix]
MGGVEAQEDANWQLFLAVNDGDLAGVHAALAAGASPDAAVHNVAALQHAVQRGHAGCATALLGSGAHPGGADSMGRTPLHHAAILGSAAASAACAAALLAGGADPAALDSDRCAAAHHAARRGHVGTLRLLLAAAPAAALLQTGMGLRPLGIAVVYGHVSAARCLLEEAPLPPQAWAGEVLAALAVASEAGHDVGCLYVPLLARSPLNAHEWAEVPCPCAGLGAALPAVVERSVDEAALLVQRLPPADRERLRPLLWPTLNPRPTPA